MSIEVDAARAGSIVLYIADRMDEARAILREEVDSNSEDVIFVGRAHGREHVRYRSGGRLIFTSIRSQGQRGHSADVVSVSALTYANPGYMLSLYPCMDTSPEACIVVRLVRRAPSERGGGTP